MAWKIALGAVIAVIVALGSLALFGRWVWHGKTEALRQELAAATADPSPATDLQTMLEGVPQPVAMYLSQVLDDDPRIVTTARISHSGTFNMGTTEPKWRPFSSSQDVFVRGPGFVWDASVRMAPGVPARVHDAYVSGRAVLTARLFGLITVMESRDSPELAQGELIRFLAEAPWYPTALLPSNALTWTPINDASARLTLVDRESTILLEVRFGEDGLIESVHSDGRYREVNGIQVSTPWEGRFWNYEERDGMLIPLDGEVAWLLPDGRWPYWRGHIDDVKYEFAR
jgi:hypothetical protein